ncbi:MAG: phospholipase D-like domain-containing protein [Desulfobulbus sp.]|nr:phospholipase D-like domain-containing protein [Desulfobulbus sp.]
MSRAYLKPLMAAGVEVYARLGTILHAKMMLIDSCWVTLGSANFDFRSFHRNFETNVIIDTHAFGLQMEALFNEELALSKRLSLTDHLAATWLGRLWEWLLTPLNRFL